MLPLCAYSNSVPASPMPLYVALPSMIAPPVVSPTMLIFTLLRPETLIAPARSEPVHECRTAPFSSMFAVAHGSRVATLKNGTSPFGSSPLTPMTSSLKMPPGGSGIVITIGDGPVFVYT